VDKRALKETGCRNPPHKRRQGALILVFDRVAQALLISRELFLIYNNINEIRSRSSAFRKLIHLMLSVSLCVCVCMRM